MANANTMSHAQTPLRLALEVEMGSIVAPIHAKLLEEIHVSFS